MAEGQYLQLTLTNLSDFTVNGAAQATDAVTGGVLGSVSGALLPGKGHQLTSPQPESRRILLVSLMFDFNTSALPGTSKTGSSDDELTICASLELVDAVSGRTLNTYEPTFESVTAGGGDSGI